MKMSFYATANANYRISTTRLSLRPHFKKANW